MERFIIIVLVMIYSLSSHATDLGKLFDVIKYVETNNEESAVGDNGKSFGLVQIQKICVDDINRMYGTTYAHEDAFNPDCAKEMFILYLRAGIKKYKVKYHEQPTESQIVRMWNGGIYRGYRVKATRRFLKKYYFWKKYLRQKRGILT